MADEPVEEQKSSGNTKNMIIIVLGALIAAAAIAGGVTYFVVKSVGGSHGTTAAEVKQQEPGKIIQTGSDFIINLQDQGGKKYLKCKISVECKYKEKEDKKFADEEIKERLPLIRDRILTVLKGKYMDDLTAVDGMNNIKKEIVKSLNQAVPGDHFINIYFEEMVLQ